MTLIKDEIQDYVRRFQFAKNFSEMVTVSWSAAVAMAELSDEQREKMHQETRGTWLWTMLSMAERELRNKKYKVITDLEEIVHLTEPFYVTEKDLGRARNMAQMALYSALLKLDEIVAVSLLFNIQPPVLRFLNKRTLGWLNWEYGSEILNSFDKTSPQMTQIMNNCPWWTIISSEAS